MNGERSAAAVTRSTYSLPANIVDAKRLPLQTRRIAGNSGNVRRSPLSESQQQAWTNIRALAKRLHDADTLLFSVPLWNFSIPYKLRQLIDVVSQRNILFSFDERGITG